MKRERIAANLILLFSLLLGLAARLWLAAFEHGIYWPDEIYNSLEPAHHLVFGYGLLPWEYVFGARIWTVPGLIAGLLKIALWLGFDTPEKYLILVKASFALVGILCALGTYLLARTHGTSHLAAAVGAAFFALAAPAIYFAPRALGETISALPIVLGLAFALPSESGRARRLIGLSLLGLASLLRMQNGLFCLALLLVYLLRRQKKPVFDAFVTFGLFAFLFGLLDQLTYGLWFHSVAANLYANVQLKIGQHIGVHSFYYYFVTLFTSLGPLAIVLGLLALLAIGRGVALWGIALLFLLVHSAIGHKELRFIYPLLPLFCGLAAIGLDQLLKFVRRPVAVLAISASLGFALLSFATFKLLTFKDLGQYWMCAEEGSAYGCFAEVNQLLLKAHQQPDLCGLKVENVHLTLAGGHSYLHRRVPLYGEGGPPQEAGHYNYLIGLRRPIDSTKLVARQGDYYLVRLPNTGCQKDRHYRWRVN